MAGGVDVELISPVIASRAEVAKDASNGARLPFLLPSGFVTVFVSGRSGTAAGTGGLDDSSWLTVEGVDLWSTDGELRPGMPHRGRGVEGSNRGGRDRGGTVVFQAKGATSPLEELAHPKQEPLSQKRGDGDAYKEAHALEIRARSGRGGLRLGKVRVVGIELGMGDGAERRRGGVR